jgi:hypothetical protein
VLTAIADLLMSEKQVDNFIDCEGLVSINKLLNDGQLQQKILTTVLWTLSQVAAGSYEQIDALVDSGELWQRVLALMGAPEYPVKHEATIVLCNVLTVSEDPNQLM